MAIFKWIVLLCLAFVAYQAFFASQSIIQETTPVQNDTLLANQSRQLDSMIDLGGAIIPGMFLLLTGWILVRVLGGST